MASASCQKGLRCSSLTRDGVRPRPGNLIRQQVPRAGSVPYVSQSNLFLPPRLLAGKRLQAAFQPQSRVTLSDTAIWEVHRTL